MTTDPEAIARDIVVAMLAEGNAALMAEILDTDDPTAAGAAVGSVYRAVLQAVLQGGDPEPDPQTPGSPSRQAGGDLSGRYPNPTIAPGVVSAEKFAVLPVVRAFRADSDQPIPDSADTPAIYNETSYDSAGMFPGTVVGDSRFTATVEGLYLVHASVRWLNNSTGARALKIRKNGGLIEFSQEIGAESPRPTTHAITAVVDMRVDDFLEAVVRQTSGASLDIQLGVGTDFSMHWLGPLPF